MEDGRNEKGVLRCSTPCQLSMKMLLIRLTHHQPYGWFPVLVHGTRADICEEVI